MYDTDVIAHSANSSPWTRADIRAQCRLAIEATIGACRDLHGVHIGPGDEETLNSQIYHAVGSVVDGLFAERDRARPVPLPRASTSASENDCGRAAAEIAHLASKVRLKPSPTGDSIAIHQGGSNADDPYPWLVVKEDITHGGLRVEWCQATEVADFAHLPNMPASPDSDRNAPPPIATATSRRTPAR
jgi:hypothetical protein